MLLRSFLFCLLCFILTGLPIAQAAMPIIAGVFLSKQEKVALSSLALNGDVAAVTELAGRLTMSNNYGEGLFWGMLAQQNGCKGCTLGLIVCLEKSPDPKQRRRARFWIKNYDKFLSINDSPINDPSGKDTRERLISSIDDYDRSSGSEIKSIAVQYRNWDFPDYPPDTNTNQAADNIADFKKLQLDAVDGDPEAA